MLLGKLSSRYRRFRVKNQYENPGRVLVADLIVQGSSVLLLLAIITVIVMMV